MENIVSMFAHLYVIGVLLTLAVHVVLLHIASKNNGLDPFFRVIDKEEKGRLKLFFVLLFVSVFWLFHIPVFISAWKAASGD